MKNCMQCIFRTERTCLKRGKIAFLDEIPEIIVTNKADFCRLGFTQNPKTSAARANALKNGANLCDALNTKVNEGWSLLELALVHASSLNEALSALPFKVCVKDYL